VLLLTFSGERKRRVQRYRCRQCGESFSRRRYRRKRYGERFAWEVVRRHVEGRQSYRVIASDLYAHTGRKISPTSLQQMVQEIAGQCKSAWEMSQELQPHWNGYLVVDEKMVSWAGRQQWFYEAIDQSGDVVHWCAVNELNVGEATRFLQEVKDLGYPCRGIVSDLDICLRHAVEGVYAEKPHQYCVKHALATIDSLIGYTPAIAQQRRMRKGLREQFQRLPDRKGMWRECSQEGFLRSWHQTRGVSRFYGAISTLHDQCRAILLSKTEKEAREQFRKLRRASTAIREEKRKAVAFLKHHWNHLMMHHRVSGLPRTTNLAEGFNKQLERRLKTIESFQHRSTAQAYSNLLIAYLRQKPYTDCRRRRKQLNGKTRLQAAHVTNLSKSWLQNCLKTPSSSNR
jgi:transposase-like protein